MLPAIIAIIVVIALYFVFTQRALVHSRENIDNALAQISVNQQSRWDALSELAKATKSYSEREYQALMDIVGKRNSGTSVTDLTTNEERLQQATNHIQVVAEQYPELKASSLYERTMNSIDGYENKVRTSRMVYNDTVTIYNRKIKQFPSSMVADSLGYTPMDYLEMDMTKANMPNLDF